MRLSRQSKIEVAPRWPCRCYDETTGRIRLHPREVVYCTDCTTLKSEWVAFAESQEVEAKSDRKRFRIIKGE